MTKSQEIKDLGEKVTKLFQEAIEEGSTTTFSFKKSDSLKLLKCKIEADTASVNKLTNLAITGNATAATIAIEGATGVECATKGGGNIYVTSRTENGLLNDLFSNSEIKPVQFTEEKGVLQAKTTFNSLLNIKELSTLRLELFKILAESKPEDFNGDEGATKTFNFMNTKTSTKDNFQMIEVTLHSLQESIELYEKYALVTPSEVVVE
jgi:uncharacterized protein (DUF342 family)